MLEFGAPEIYRLGGASRISEAGKYQTKNSSRSVIRAYIVGGKIVGCYTTDGYEIVNCAGLARESKAKIYTPTKKQAQILMDSAKLVKSTGYCRIDAVGEKEHFSIIEINPLARIDAESHGLDIPRAVLEYAIELNERRSDEI